MQLKVIAERGVAEGHANLARLYRDMGLIDKVEQNLKDLVEINGEVREDLIAARRELAEFYRTQNKTKEAVLAYNKLINDQEKLDEFEEGYAKFGQDIANSYDELASVYRTQAEDYKSTDVTNLSGEMKTKIAENIKRANEASEMSSALSTAIQRFSTRLRQWLTAPDRGSKDRDELANNVANAYVNLGKFDRALALYSYALKIRTNGNVEERASLGKSYERLARFYRIQKDYSKAAENYDKLITFYRDNPRRGDYVVAMLQCWLLFTLRTRTLHLMRRCPSTKGPAQSPRNEVIGQLRILCIFDWQSCSRSGTRRQNEH